MQVDALLKKHGSTPPAIIWLADQLEALGCATWCHRIVNTASKPLPACSLLCQAALAARRSSCWLLALLLLGSTQPGLG